MAFDDPIESSDINVRKPAPSIKMKSTGVYELNKFRDIQELLRNSDNHDHLQTRLNETVLLNNNNITQIIKPNHLAQMVKKKRPKTSNRLNITSNY